jgi:hypothetical protein
MLLMMTCSFTAKTSLAETEPIQSGSFIVNMGVVPQTYGNGVKPWGMIFDLIKNHHVQVKWVINPSKARFGKDFTYQGVDYKGGTFIILQQYRTAAVNARIAYWQTKGVVGVTTSSNFDVNVTYTLKYTPKWTFDYQNGKIAIGFLISAGIDTAGFRKRYPSELDGCDDIFVMPHADPTWATHKNLLAWNKNNKGWIWAGCHAVSVLESLYNPANPSEKMNFLSTTGLVLWNNHKDASAPFSYQNPADPEMQFMGKVEDAMDNGSEQVFLPLKGGAWRPTTTVGVYDPTQLDIPSKSSGPAGLLLYGYAFGDATRGKIMYAAGHDNDKNNEDAVSALRAFFNFSFMSVLNKQHASAMNGQTSIATSGFYDYKVVLPQGYNTADYTYQWSSSCNNGSFSNPTGPSTNFIPAAGFVGGCEISVNMTDGCGRQYYQTIAVGGVGRPAPEEKDKFTGNFVNGYSELTWKTVTDENVEYFVIERSRDGNRYDELGVVTTNGNGSMELNYSYLDQDAKPGTNYYRLKKVDQIGQPTYSKRIAVYATAGRPETEDRKYYEEEEENLIGAFVNGYSQLTWNTASGRDIEYFEIERSVDGESFDKIGTLSTNGNGSQALNYSYLDLIAKPGNNYYRLKIFDQNGDFAYSKVTSVNSEKKDINILLVYPNPFGHKVQVQLESEKQEKVIIRVVANNGAIVRNQVQEIGAGRSTIIVNNVADLPQGLYHLQIITPDKTMSMEIMKQK